MPAWIELEADDGFPTLDNLGTTLGAGGGGGGSVRVAAGALLGSLVILASTTWGEMYKEFVTKTQLL